MVHTGLEKTALFLNGLPEEAAQTLLQRLEPQEAAQIRVEMRRLSGVAPEQVRKVVADFLSAIETGNSPQLTQQLDWQRPRFDRLGSMDGLDSFEPSPMNSSVSTPSSPGPENQKSGWTNQTELPNQTGLANQADSGNQAGLANRAGVGNTVSDSKSGSVFQTGFADLTVYGNPLHNRHATPSVQQSLPVELPLTKNGTDESSTSGTFGFLHTIPPLQIRELLLAESCPVIALVLAHLPTDLAGQVLQHFPTEEQRELIMRVAELEETDDEVLADIELALSERLEEQQRQYGNRRRIKGLHAAREMLKRIDPELRTGLFQVDPLGRTVKSEQGGETGMTLGGVATLGETARLGKEKTRKLGETTFSAFDELQGLSDTELTQLFSSVDQRTALLALCGAPKSLIERIVRDFTPEEERVMQRRFQELGVIDPNEVDEARKIILEKRRCTIRIGD
ncbi:MAG: FliG C-terminal domain-containing protein [Thermoguttaceae bacterium]